MSSATSAIDNKAGLIEMHQQMFEVKSSQLFKKVIGTDLTAFFLKNGRSFISTPLEFKATYIDPLQEPIMAADERTKVFFEKMMTTLEKAVSMTPIAIISTLNTRTNDSTAGMQLIRGLAFPNVQELIAELDKENTNIVEEIDRPVIN